MSTERGNMAADRGQSGQAIIGTEAKEVYDTSFHSISTSFVLSRDRGFVEGMSTASDISSIGTAYKISKSGITCYDLASTDSKDPVRLASP